MSDIWNVSLTTYCGRERAQNIASVFFGSKKSTISKKNALTIPCEKMSKQSNIDNIAGSFTLIMDAQYNTELDRQKL